MEKTVNRMKSTALTAKNVILGAIRAIRASTSRCCSATAKFLYERRLPLFLAFLHFFVTTVFQFDKLFFEYDETYTFIRGSTGEPYSMFWYYCAVKFLFFCFLCILYCAVAFVIRLYKSKNEKFRRGFSVFCFYLVLMMALLIILWPGTWSWDDIHTVVALQKYSGGWWQHFITSVVQMMFLQLIPCAGGIIIIQNVIISAIVAYSVTKLEDCVLPKPLFKNRLLDIFVKVLPFLLPGALAYQFCGFRMGLYMYLMLALAVMLISSRIENSEWTFAKVALYSILSVFVAEWRTESLFFFPFTLIFLIVQKKANCRTKFKIFGIFLIVAGFCTTDFVQKKLLKDSNYEIVSTLHPITEIIRLADGRDEADIRIVSKILNLQAIYDYPEKSGNALYGMEEAEFVSKTYTKSDYKAYLKAFFRMSLRHPIFVAKERIEMFMLSSGFLGRTAATNLTSGTTPFNLHESENVGIQKFIAFPHNQPIFGKIRLQFLRLMINEKTWPLLWNIAIPTLFLFAAWIFCLVRQKWYFFLILTGEAARVAIAFLTAPSPYFMYYLPEYILGWSLFVWGILYAVQAKK